MENVTRPLTGVKVVEMATFIAVPAAGRLLSDMGAQVIKIESSKGDNLRFTAPSEGRPLDQDENTSFDLENSGKKVITLDVRGPKGKEILYKLLDEADIFLTNWRPGALARQDLDYEHIKAKYPSLVYGNVTGYGEKGPKVNLPGFDAIAMFATGGLIQDMMVDAPGSYPVYLPMGFGDLVCGTALAGAIGTALYGRTQSGKGDYVSISLYGAAMWMFSRQVSTRFRLCSGQSAQAC